MRWGIASLVLLAGCAYTPLRTHELDGTPADPIGQLNTIYLEDGEARDTAIAIAAWAAFEQLARSLVHAKALPTEPEYGPCGPACGPVAPTP